MTFHIEFPDYPAADMPAIPAGFVDMSWHNDTCPCFINMPRRLMIWTDYADPAQREFGSEQPRFSLSRCDEYGAFEAAVTTSDEWADILTALESV